VLDALVIASSKSMLGCKVLSAASSDANTAVRFKRGHMHPFFTIGHSNRPLEEFVALLAKAEVRLVVDVRIVPRSRANPQFNRDALPASLAPYGIAYQHLAALGGLPRNSANRFSRAQRLLGQRELPQLRRLRDERGVPLRRCPKTIASFRETSARCCSSILDGMSLGSC